jgi:hypothetical protein
MKGAFADVEILLGGTMRRKAMLNSKGRLSYRNAEAYRIIARGMPKPVADALHVMFTMLIYWAVVLALSCVFWLFGHSYLAAALLLYGVWDVGKFFYTRFRVS